MSSDGSVYQNRLVSASMAVQEVSAMNATTSTVMNHQLAHISELRLDDEPPSHMRVSAASTVGSFWKPGGQ